MLLLQPCGFSAFRGKKSLGFLNLIYLCLCFHLLKTLFQFLVNPKPCSPKATLYSNVWQPYTKSLIGSLASLLFLALKALKGFFKGFHKGYS